MNCTCIRENDTCSALTIFRNDEAATQFQKGLVAEARTHTKEIAGKCPRPDLARRLDPLNDELADVSACVVCLALNREIREKIHQYSALDAFKAMISENLILDAKSAQTLIS